MVDANPVMRFEILPSNGQLTNKWTGIWDGVGAANLVLTAEDLSKIKEILPKGGFGERYAKEYAPTWI